MEYNEWIDELFNREPVDEFELDWSEDFFTAVYQMSSEQMLCLIATTFERAGSDLANYSDVQTALGINLLTNEVNDPLRVVYDVNVPLALRQRTIESFVPLYRDFFAKRCDNGMLDDSHDPLDMRCYMLWDAGIMSIYGFMTNGNDPDREILCEAMMDMFEQILFIPNMACQESALHGLGHSIMCCHDRELFPKSYARRMVDMIKRFLKIPSLEPKLRKYAKLAMTGQIM